MIVLKNLLIKSLFTSILCIAIGILFLVLPSNDLVNFVFNAAGIVVVLLNIFPCIYFFILGSKNEKLYGLAVMYLIPVVVGFIMIFNHHVALAIILGVYLILEPILRIILLKDKKEQIFKAIPYFIIALILFFVPVAKDLVLTVGVRIFGGVILAFGIAGVIYNIFFVKKIDDSNDKPKEDHGEIIDIEYKEL